MRRGLTGLETFILLIAIAVVAAVVAYAVWGAGVTLPVIGCR